MDASKLILKVSEKPTTSLLTSASIIGLAVSSIMQSNQNQKLSCRVAKLEEERAQNQNSALSR